MPGSRRLSLSLVLPGPRVREKCFLHVRQTSFLHAAKMFFTASESTAPEAADAARRKGTAWWPRARPTGRLHGLAANGNGLRPRPPPTAWRPNGNGLRPGESCTAIKSRCRAWCGWWIGGNHAPQSSLMAAAGLLWRARSCPCALPMLLPAPAWLWSRSSGAGPCLCFCLCLCLCSCALALLWWQVQGSP